MIEEPRIATDPRLPLREVEDAAAGLRILEVMLDSSGTSVAPFKAACFSVEPGYTTPVDSHSMREIWLVTGGSGELIYDGKTTSIRKSDIVYFEPPKPHQVRNDGSDSLVIFSVWWDAPVV
jgi:mannose-6-phosphate isomerase-like protein (cupin superfamily)